MNRQKRHRIPQLAENARQCVGMGDKDGDSNTLHAHGNLFPEAANQMRPDQRGLTVIGHWPITYRMPERNGRIVCANESLLRNTIMSKMLDGWEMAPVFHLMCPFSDRTRVGKGPASTVDSAQCASTQADNENNGAPPVPSTSDVVHTALEETDPRPQEAVSTGSPKIEGLGKK